MKIIACTTALMATRRLFHQNMFMRGRPFICNNTYADAYRVNISPRLRYCTTSSQGQAVKLSYSVHEGNVLPEQPVMILHGLLGTGKNFDAIAKQLVKTTGRTVVTFDARNHGNSEHSDEMSYSAMVADILNLLDELKANSCIPIGHSLGGRTAMTLALIKPELVDKLVCIDISPVHHGTNTEVHSFLLGMKKLKVPKDLNTSEARRYANEEFSSIIPNKNIRDFILTNLIEKNGQMTWRVNVDALLKNFRELGRISKDLPPYRGPTLFIGGSLSDYIKQEDLQDITEIFPRSQVKIIEGAGHWVHHEKPQELLNHLTEFLKS